MSGSDRTQATFQMAEDNSDESVKLALASFFSDSPLHGEAVDYGQNQLIVEDIPERVRPILLEKWRLLRSNLDSSQSRRRADPTKGDAGK